MTETCTDWRSKLILNDKENPRALFANATTAFRDAPEWAGILWFDAFRHKLVLRGQAPWMTEAADEDWTPTHDARAAEWIQHQGVHVSLNIAGEAIETVASERRFHPVLDYLNRCAWDGEHRIDDWAFKYLGAEDTPFVRAVAPRFLISAVARVMVPGCKADHALILEGPQGTLKSTALKTLAQPWFTDDIADLGSKDAAMQVAGTWLLELAELDAISRAEVSKIKGFISRMTDRFRPPYGRRVVEIGRQCVFAGTVNINEYLRDETGARRFWPVACGRIDIDGLAGARDQLWAEARDRYLAGETWWLDNGRLNADAREAQQSRYQADAWQEPIAEFLIPRHSVSVAEILRDALHLSVDRWGQTDANRVARCLRALTWERYQVGSGHDRGKWRYRPSQPTTTEHERTDD